MAIGIMITSLLGMHTTCSHTLSDFYEQMFVVLMNKVQRLSTYRWMKKEHQYMQQLYFSCEISDVYIHRVFYRWKNSVLAAYTSVVCLVTRNLHLQIYMEASGVHFPTYTIW